MNLSYLPKVVTFLLLLAFGPLDAADKSHNIPAITLIHPDAKDVESFFQSRQIALGRASLDKRSGLEKAEFGWEVSRPSLVLNNFTDEVLFLEQLKLLTTEENLIRLRAIEKDLDSFVYSKHPTREGFWELAGYVSDRPVEKDAIWDKMGMDSLGYWNLYETRRLRFHEALPKALADLEHADLKVRLKAAKNLAEMGEDFRKAIPVIVDVVTAALEGDTDDEGKGDAIATIDTIHGKMIKMFGESEGMSKVIPSLVKVIESDVKAEHPELTSKAIYALYHFESDATKDAIPVLMKSLSSDNLEIVHGSVIMLAKVAAGDPQVRKALTPFLDDEDEYIRGWVKASLKPDADEAEN